MNKTKIIIDCDQVTMMLLLLCLQQTIQQLTCALTTVAGNQTLEKTTNNALHICEP